MLVSFRNFLPVSQPNNKSNNNIRYGTLNQLNRDTVSFTGMSKPSQYGNIFEFLAAKILSTAKKPVVDDELLSANHIREGVSNVFESNNAYSPYTQANTSKIKWQAYVPEDIKVFSVQKINDARVERLDSWKKVLESPEKMLKDGHEALADKLKNNKSLKIVIWNAVNSELKENNRHIPVPFNAEALEQTIQGFEAIAPLDRKVRCKEISFLEMYTHRLRDNILSEKGITDEKSVWVKIPSIKHDYADRHKNVSEVEVLSYKNWCTRSSVDKAEDVLKDGDFYIYLERGKSDMWQPLIGMATSENKINQIQGVENNNIVPVKQLSKIKDFIQEKNLKCESMIVDEGPKAGIQIMISDKLAELKPEIGKTFEKSLKDNDVPAIFKYLNKPFKTLEDGTYEIKGYKPTYNADANKGIMIPLNMMGVDEDKLLANVSRIKGDMILDNKNMLYKSFITEFPGNLKEVTGKISCTRPQYERFGDRMKDVVSNPKNIVVHNWN